ncbi:Limbic system-associated membrane protein [Apis cerana cerana]|uniref:Limbic system-associated membrane protein n=1 Tax=Apis cerana cerana TaxID=94128 RepID=A0A2A3ELG4_APICC|nr:Limbic system-associated membrane protein [Apis cerana cerana]
MALYGCYFSRIGAKQVDVGWYSVMYKKFSNRLSGGVANSRHRAPFRHLDAVELHRVGGENRASGVQSEKSRESYGNILFMKIAKKLRYIKILKRKKKEIKIINVKRVSVSWVRHRDIHLLTVGRYTYTSDQRFEALHLPHAEEWTLRIRYPQKKDSGIYECQISTTPPIGHPVYLTIVEPITIIIGAPDLFVNKGSTINLTCVVKYAPEPPPMMIWSHNSEVEKGSTFETESQVINFDSPRGGISLVTEKGPETTSRLMIQKAVMTDSGIYTCEPSNANPNRIKVHVVDEKCRNDFHRMSPSS